MGFDDSFFMSKDAPTRNIKFPRIGAFEVYYNQKVIFSKLEIGTWPNSAGIAEKIKNAGEADKLPPLVPQTAKAMDPMRRRRLRKVKRKLK